MFELFLETKQFFSNIGLQENKLGTLYSYHCFTFAFSINDITLEHFNKIKEYCILKNIYFIQQTIPTTPQYIQLLFMKNGIDTTEYLHLLNR